jgi:hypothetical protein
MSASSCLVKHGLETNVVWRQVLEEQDCQSGAAPFDFEGAGFLYLLDCAKKRKKLAMKWVA